MPFWRKKETIWQDAIDKKNKEAELKRDASEFFGKNSRTQDSNATEDTLLNKQEPKTIIEREEVIVYTSKKPIENLSKIKRMEKAKKIGIFGAIISSLLLALVLIPVAIVLGAAALVIDDTPSSRELLGYRVDETEFSVKDVNSGEYLQSPTQDGEQLIFSTNEEQTFQFSQEEYASHNWQPANYNDFWLKTDKIFNSEKMFLTLENNKPIWTNVEEDSSIHLDKNPNERNQFAITFSNKGAYVGYDSKTHKATLSGKPNWFTFEAKVEPIKTFDEYQDDYKDINSSFDWYLNDPKAGVQGNPLSIQSATTGKWINSYKTVEHSDIPLFFIEDDEYESSLRMGNKSDTNLFIENVNDEMEIGSYQTLPFKYFAQDDNQKYYPVMVASNDGTVKLKLNAYSVNMADELGQAIIPEGSKIWLLPNPNNLREKAIYFVDQGAFLDTRGGYFTLQKITDPSEIYNLDYFNFYHSPRRNPERTYISNPIIRGNEVKIKVNSDFWEQVDGYELYTFEYDSLAEAYNDPLNYIGRHNFKTDATKRYEVIKTNGLKYSTPYQGILATYRNDDSGVGKHVTFRRIPPFETGDNGGGDGWPGFPIIDWPNWPGGGGNIDWPNINWPPSWPPSWPPGIDWPPIISKPIDPGDPTDNGGSGTAATAKIWDSTDEEGPNNGKSDIAINDMLTSADDSIEVSVELNQGTEDGVTDMLGVKLEEVDDKGDVIKGGYSKEKIVSTTPVNGKTYTTIFDGLTAETNYKATVLFYDSNVSFEQEQSSPLKLDYGETQMWATTERVAPLVTNSGYDWDATGSGIQISGNIDNLRDTDEINVTILDKGSTGTEHNIITTGWIKTSDWESTTVKDWTLFKNGDYYQATYTRPRTINHYDVHMWVRMDTTKDFQGWDLDSEGNKHDSPAFDDTYEYVTGGNRFGIIKVLEKKEVIASRNFN